MEKALKETPKSRVPDVVRLARPCSRTSTRRVTPAARAANVRLIPRPAYWASPGRSVRVGWAPDVFHTGAELPGRLALRAPGTRSEPASGTPSCERPLRPRPPG